MRHDLDGRAVEPVSEEHRTGAVKAVQGRRRRRDKAVDEETSVLSGIEPAVHVPARFESRDHLLGHRDLGAIARVSSGAGVARLDREHAKVAQLNPVPLRQRRS